MNTYSPCSRVPRMVYVPRMELIPAPYVTRTYTDWQALADGLWRRAVQEEDFPWTHATTWARSGRAWAKRHGYDKMFIVHGRVVEFRIAHPRLAGALAEWDAATAVFFEGSLPEPLAQKPVAPPHKAA